MMSSDVMQHELVERAESEALTKADITKHSLSTGWAPVSSSYERLQS